MVTAEKQIEPKTLDKHDLLLDAADIENNNSSNIFLMLLPAGSRWRSFECKNL